MEKKEMTNGTVSNLIAVVIFLVGAYHCLAAVIYQPLVVLCFVLGAVLCWASLTRAFTAFLYVADWFRTSRRRGN